MNLSYLQMQQVLFYVVCNGSAVTQSGQTKHSLQIEPFRCVHFSTSIFSCNQQLYQLMPLSWKKKVVYSHVFRCLLCISVCELAYVLMRLSVSAELFQHSNDSLIFTLTKYTDGVFVHQGKCTFCTFLYACRAHEQRHTHRHTYMHTHTN